MPEPAATTALIPVEGEYIVDIREFDAAGRATNFRLPIPANVSANQASVMLRAVLLKKTTWKQYDIPTIVTAVLYADNMGLDAMAGDVYMTPEGRISTTAGAKIRHAMSTNRIKGYSVELTKGPDVTLEWRTKDGPQKLTTPDLRVKVTVTVAGWEKPVIYEAFLEEWFVGTNPNWRNRPAYMLRKNALSKAMDEIAPMGVESDEAPPLAETSSVDTVSKTS